VKREKEREVFLLGDNVNCQDYILWKLGDFADISLNKVVHFVKNAGLVNA
jgi:hypothetical protein